MGYLYLASLQKGKRPNFFEKANKKVVTTYRLRSEIFGTKACPKEG
jgi:hypothetical protein